MVDILDERGRFIGRAPEPEGEARQVSYEVSQPSEPQIDVLDERGRFIGRASWFEDDDARREEALAAKAREKAPHDEAAESGSAVG